MKKKLEALLILSVLIVLLSSCGNHAGELQLENDSGTISSGTISSEILTSHTNEAESSDTGQSDSSAESSEEDSNQSIPSDLTATSSQGSSAVASQPATESPAPKKDLSVVVKKESLVGAQEINITDDAEIEKILAFTDGMQKSDFADPPPTGGEIMSVFITRNGVTEEYSFLEDQVDGYGLAKNHQDPNVRSVWYYAATDAYTYLANFLE